MRPEARLKAGFYAAPEEALRMLVSRLIPTQDDRPTAILDPCAGEGAALQQISLALKVPEERCYGIELDEERGNVCRQRMPGARWLSPCSFFHTRIRAHSFGLVYCNPPFDDLGGGSNERMELTFFRRSTELLRPGGVGVLVCPEHVATTISMKEFWLEWYDYITMARFPPHCRRFNEVFMFGRRRRERAPSSESRGWKHVFNAGRLDYHVAPAGGPEAAFQKTGYTDHELEQALANSPLNARLQPPPPADVPSPPLALGAGHIALLLSSGHLDGLVCPPGEAPHVVRGTAKKAEEVVEQEEVREGSTKRTTTVYRERIKLIVRTVDAGGIITTFE